MADLDEAGGGKPGANKRVKRARVSRPAKRLRDAREAYEQAVDIALQDYLAAVRSVEQQGA